MKEATGHPRIRDAAADLLMLRSTVGSFLEQVERLEANHVIIDFSEVQFMSRTFADEYLTLKAASKKQIEETHVPSEVQRMFDVVSRQRASTRPRDLSTRQPARRRATISR